MIAGKVYEFRVAVVGLEGAGKSGVIRRICAGSFAETEHTETEQQSTSIRDDIFTYFWEFPPAQLDGADLEVLVVGFSAIIFVFDINEVSTQFSKSKAYLQQLMQSPVLNSLPYLLVGAKLDTLAEPLEQTPSQIMKCLTENLKKTQIALTSARDGTGMSDIDQWIRERANPTRISEVTAGHTGSPLSLLRRMG